MPAAHVTCTGRLCCYTWCKYATGGAPCRHHSWGVLRIWSEMPHWVFVVRTDDRIHQSLVCCLLTSHRLQSLLLCPASVSTSTSYLPLKYLESSPLARHFTSTCVHIVYIIDTPLLVSNQNHFFLLYKTNSQRRSHFPSSTSAMSMLILNTWKGNT